MASLVEWLETKQRMANRDAAFGVMPDRRYGQAADRITALEAELAEAKAWRDAVDDQLVISHIGTWESFPDARTALSKLLEWTAVVAVDPAVSQPARDLVAPLEAMCETLAGALEWYGEPVLTYAITQASEPRSAVHADGGKRAREALTQYRAMKGQNDG